MCIFIKLNITAQTAPDILIFLYYSNGDPPYGESVVFTDVCIPIHDILDDLKMPQSTISTFVYR